MNKLSIYKNYYKYRHNIKKINHNSKIYYELIIPGSLDKNDIIVFETNPLCCNHCNIFFSKYTEIYNLYKYLIQKKVNKNIYHKISNIIDTIHLYHYIKVESNLIGTNTFWYIHLCNRCYN